MRTATSTSTLFLLGLWLFAALPTSVSAAPARSPIGINSPLAPRDGPPPATKVPPARTNPASRVKPLLKNIIDKLKEEVGDGEPPVIEEDVYVDDDDVEYPPRAEAKIKKKKDADAKDDPDDQACALEICKSRDDQVCVHMAGREFWNMWFTCCEEGEFADFDGYCCEKRMGEGSGHTNLCPGNPRNHSGT